MSKYEIARIKMEVALSNLEGAIKTLEGVEMDTSKVKDLAEATALAKLTESVKSRINGQRFGAYTRRVKGLVNDIMRGGL